MTITELLADLEAKAKRAQQVGSLYPAWTYFKDACSPDRILALMGYVRKLEKLVPVAERFQREVLKSFSISTGTISDANRALSEVLFTLDALAGDAEGKKL